MIRVQPARSRIVKEEADDQLTLTMPPKGFRSVGGGVLSASLLMLGLCATGIVLARSKGTIELGVFSGVVAAFALFLAGGGLSACLRTWRIDRNAVFVTARIRGLFGTSMRRWAAEDISSLWTRQVDESEYALVIGFRNGRSEDLLFEVEEEDLRWAATMLSDPRGERKAASPGPLQAAEPPRIRTAEANIPGTLAVRKFSNGVELSFLPLIQSRGLWWRLPGAALLALTLILGASSILIRLTHGAFPAWFARAGSIAVVAALAVRYWKLRRSAVIQIADRVLTLVENQGRGTFQIPADAIDFVQTFAAPGRSELQILRRGQPKLRLLEGRPAEELEWAARFLRVALKSRPIEAISPMKVDAAVGDCQVCSEKMESRVVYCAKCRTPHHEECWAYVGMCSTYACREIRFTRDGK